jgi:hypothetical protein
MLCSSNVIISTILGLLILILGRFLINTVQDSAATLITLLQKTLITLHQNWKPKLLESWELASVDITIAP